jgi:HEAT repeat protein
VTVRRAAARASVLFVCSALAAAQEPVAASRPAAAPAAQPATRPEITPAAAAQNVLGERPTVRKQAVEWIKANPKEGVPALATALVELPVEKMSFDGVRATGAIVDERVSVALLRLLDRPGFRWRPHAFEALADHAYAGAVHRFEAGTNEPTWRARAACVRGLAAIKSTPHAALFLALLEDEEAPVRLEAAKALRSFGDPAGLPHVVRDLSLDRRFFDADHGSLARDAAATLLNEVVGPGSFPVPHPPLDLRAMRAVLKRVKAAAGDRAAGFPELVPPHDADVPELRYAFEVRSCVEGDLHVRFDADGAVVFGRDRLQKLNLGAAATAPLVKFLDGYDYGPRGKKIFGPVNCDFERFGTFVDGAWRTAIVGERKRPQDCAAFVAAMENLVKLGLGGPSAAAHATRARRFEAAR